MVHQDQSRGGKVWGCLQGGSASLAGGEPAGASPSEQHRPVFCSRMQGILEKYHDFLPRKCLLLELPLFGILTCCFQTRVHIVEHLGCRCLAAAQQHHCKWWPLAEYWCHLNTWQSSICFPCCAVIFLIQTSYLDLNQGLALSSARTVSLVSLLWVTELIALSLLLLPEQHVYTLDKVGCNRIFQH